MPKHLAEHPAQQLALLAQQVGGMHAQGPQFVAHRPEFRGGPAVEPVGIARRAGLAFSRTRPGRVLPRAPRPNRLRLLCASR